MVEDQVIDAFSNPGGQFQSQTKVAAVEILNRTLIREKYLLHCILQKLDVDPIILDLVY